MARSHARLWCSIWGDPDFLALDSDAQRLYMLALSQPNVTMCGVVPYTPKRWAGLAADQTPGKVKKAASKLEAGRFCLVDPETEELLLRSFVRWDGVLDSPNLVIAMWKDVPFIHSSRLREVFLFELPDTVGFPEGFERPCSNPLTEGFGEGLPDSSPFTSPSPQPLRGGVFDADFDEWWQVYPRRVDRGHALKAYVARRNEGAGAEDLLKAVRHYRSAVASTDPRYIKHGKTFLGKETWVEWVDGAPDGARDAISAVFE